MSPVRFVVSRHIVTSMRKIGLVILGIVVLGLVGYALFRQQSVVVDRGLKPETTSQAPPAPQEPELVNEPRTQLAEAKKLIDSGAVTVIDVRDADSYIASHIPGAMQIPLARIEGEIDYLPKGKPIITYCT
jgi:rhodanese-like protein